MDLELALAFVESLEDFRGRSPSQRVFDIRLDAEAPPGPEERDWSVGFRLGPGLPLEEMALSAITAAVNQTNESIKAGRVGLDRADPDMPQVALRVRGRRAVIR